MYGFTKSNSTFYDILSSVISRVPQDALIQLFGFGRDSIKLEGDLRQMLHAISDRRFYSQQDTDLCKPFEGHIQDDPNAVYLIFTDMVQSTKYADQDRVMFARHLKGYLGENGFFAIMSTQAEFSGEYFSEKMNGKVNVPDGSTRPLYCLTFGHRKYSRFIVDKFSSLFTNTYDFGSILPNKLRCTDNADYTNDPKTFLFDQNIVDLPVSCFQLKKGQSESLKITMSGYEDRFGGVIDYSIAYKSKADSIFTELKSLKGNIRTEALLDNSRITFKIPFNHNNPGQYIVRLTFRKTLPNWIRDLSTDDDTKLSNINKTYKLGSWMGFIMDNFEDYQYLATTQYYIHINRK